MISRFRRIADPCSPLPALTIKNQVFQSARWLCVLGSLLAAAASVSGQATIANGATTVSFPTTAVGSSAAAESVLVKVTSAEKITSITVPPSLNNKQEYTVGKITGCVVDGNTTNATGTVCAVPVTFSPAYPGLRPAPLQVVTSSGNVNFGLIGTGTGPLASFVPGMLRTIAGNGTPGDTGDGDVSTYAELSAPGRSAVDSAGNLYFADTGNNSIRMITASTGVIVTVAGSKYGYTGAPVDGGLATSALLNAPTDVAIDSAGNLYIADAGNNRVRMVTAATGIITTIAGNGSNGSSGDGGPAVDAELIPTGIAVDIAGNVYVSDQTHNDVREVAAATQKISTLIGPGPLNAPSGLAVDPQGNLYIANTGDDLVEEYLAATQKLVVFAGFGQEDDFTGDGGPANRADLDGPTSVKLDGAGNVYITDYYNDRLHEVSVATGIINTIVGDGQQVYTNDGIATSIPLAPYAVSVDAEGNLFISDGRTPRLYEVTVGTTTLTYPTATLLGQTDVADNPKSTTLSNIGNAALILPAPEYDSNPSISPGWSLDGDSTCPQLNVGATPYSLVPGGTCFLAVDFAPTTSGPTAGTLDLTDNSLNVKSAMQAVTLNGTGTSVAQTMTTLAPSVNPSNSGQTVVFTAVVSFIAQAGTPTGTVQFYIDSVAFGSPVKLDGSGTANSQPDNALAAGMHSIYAYFTPASPATEGSSSAITLEQSVIPTAGKIILSEAAGNLVFPSTAVGASSTAQMVTFTTGAAETINSVTVPVSEGYQQEYTIGKITGCAVDGTTVNPAGATCSVPVTFSPAYPGARPAPLEIITGTGNVNFGLNGIGTGPLGVLLPGVISALPDPSSKVSSPLGSAIDSAGNLYFADYGSNTVTEIDLGTQTLSIAAGGTLGYTGDGGFATNASLNAPVDVALDSAGNIYIADQGNNVVRKVTAATQLLSTIAGNGSAGHTGDGGPAIAATMTPSGVVVDTAGNLYIADATAGVVRKVSANGVISTVAGNGTIGHSGDGGLATSAELGQPMGLALNGAGDLYIADARWDVVRKVAAATGLISTVAGVPYDYIASGFVYKESGDGGLATAAYLGEPTFIQLDSAGDLYIADTAPGTVRKVAAATGVITTIAGSQLAFDTPYGLGGPATGSVIGVQGIALDGAGNLFISDPDDSLILDVSASLSTLNYPTTTTVGSPDTTDDPQTATLANIGNAALTLAPPATGTNPAISKAWSLDKASTCPLLSTSSAAYALGAGAACTFAVDFTPTQATNNLGYLDVTDNSLNLPGSTQTAKLTGNSVAVAIPPTTTTSIVINASYNPITAGQPVFFAARVTDPNYTPGAGVSFGTVQFLIDGKAFGGATSPDPANNGILRSMTTTTLSVGQHVITAVYTPGAGSISKPSTSAPLTEIVYAAGTTLPTTTPDTFVVTRQDDLSARSAQFNDETYTAGVASDCVNQTPGASYQTGGTDNSLCSYRDAVTAANGTIGAVITFASTVGSVERPGTLTIEDDVSTFAPMTIQGPGSKALTIPNASIIIYAPGLTTVSGLTMLNTSDVVIDNIVGETILDDITTIGGGDCTCFQGNAIVRNSNFSASSQGTLYASNGLELSNSVLRGGHEVGLTVLAGTVSITNTVFDSTADLNPFFSDDIGAGAIEIDGSANVTVTNSTFTGNQSPDGAAIYMTGTGAVTVSNSTFSGNVSLGTGQSAGIIYNSGTGPLTIRDSTIYGNTDGDGGSPITFKTVAPTLINTILAGENGLASGGTCTGCTDSGTNLIGVDPQLGPLGNYSPLAQIPLLQTYVPLPTSPAVCKGSATTDTTDELGDPRPSGSCYDIGAVQTAYTLVFTVQPTTTAVGAKISPAPAVQLSEHGVPVSGELIALTDSLGAGSLTGPTTVSGGADGTATFTGLSPQKSGPQTLTATFGALTVTSDSFTTSTISVVTPTVTLTINPSSQIYGTAVAAGTFTGSATYNGTSIPGTFTYTATPAGGAPIAISQGSTVLPAASYSVVAKFTPTDTESYNSASSTTAVPNYVVNAATANITLSDLTATYNGSAHSVTATTLPAGLTVSITYSGSATAPTAAGSYAVVATITSPNYTGSSTGTLIIARAAAKVTLSGLAASYDGKPHAVTATTTPAGLSVSITYNGSTTAPTAVGTYTVTATITDSNYTGSATGTLLISSSTTAATVTLSGLSATYNGSPHSVTATTSPAGLTVSITYNGSATAPTAAGSYAVVATVTSPNYTGSSTGTLIIAKAAATVTLTNLTANYDGNPHSATVTTFPAGLSVNVTYNGSASAPIAAGSYTVVTTVTDPNYMGSATGVYTIAIPAPASISSASGSAQTSAYGSGFALPLVVIVKDKNGNPSSGAVVSFSGTGLKFSSSKATTGSNGEASVTAIAIASGNLTATATTTGVTGTANFSLTATQVQLTVTASNVSVPYGQQIPALTYTVTGFVNGDTTSILSGAPAETTTATQNSAVGTYSIIPSLGTLAAANYTFNFTDGTLTITSLGTVATPTFAPAAGTYTSAQSITISDATPGAVIHYTTNGTTPTPSSPTYAAPIAVAASETIEAIAVATGYSESAVASAVYTVNLPVPGFSVAVNPSSLTVQSGQSGTVTVSVTPQNAFASQISFACSGLPAGSTCSFSPASVTPSGTVASTTTMTVATSSTSAALHKPGSLFSGATLAAALCFFGWKKRRRLQLVLLIAMCVSGLGLLSGCGGSSSSHATQPTTSTVTVTATSGSIQNTANFSLTVN